DPLAQRAGRYLNAFQLARLRVPGSAGAELAELLYVIEREVVAGQVEHGVQQDRGVPTGEHEAVPVGPVRVGGVVVHDPRPQDVGQRGQGHGRAWVARVG